MALYEMRTYTVVVGKMSDVVALYRDEGWSALEKHAGKLCGYFTGDVGAMNTLSHLWRFQDDADRRAHWDRVFADKEFMGFAAKLRPMLQSQENKLMFDAPWGPKP
jgi:hypothetical protein